MVPTRAAAFVVLFLAGCAGPYPTAPSDGVPADLPFVEDLYSVQYDGDPSVQPPLRGNTGPHCATVLVSRDPWSIVLRNEDAVPRGVFVRASERTGGNAGQLAETHAVNWSAFEPEEGEVIVLGSPFDDGRVLLTLRRGPFTFAIEGEGDPVVRRVEYALQQEGGDYRVAHTFIVRQAADVPARAVDDHGLCA